MDHNVLNVNKNSPNLIYMCTLFITEQNLAQKGQDIDLPGYMNSSLNVAACDIPSDLLFSNEL